MRLSQMRIPLYRSIGRLGSIARWVIVATLVTATAAYAQRRHL